MAWQEFQNRKQASDVRLVGGAGKLAVTIRRELAETFGLTEGARINVFTDLDNQQLAFGVAEDGGYKPTLQGARYRVSVSAAVNALGLAGVPQITSARVSSPRGLGKALVVALQQGDNASTTQADSTTQVEAPA